MISKELEGLEKQIHRAFESGALCQVRVNYDYDPADYPDEESRLEAETEFYTKAWNALLRAAKLDQETQAIELNWSPEKNVLWFYVHSPEAALNLARAGYKLEF